MMVQSGMPERFWKFAYSLVAFLHNRLPNSWCLNSLPHQELFGTAPSIVILYPFGADAIVHVPTVNQPHKLVPRGIECKLLKPLMLGGWLLWDPSTNKMVQWASIIFPQFQPATDSSRPIFKGSLGHVVNTMSLGEVPTECLFAAENQVIDSLILVKDVNIPEHLGRALLGPHRKKWRQACLAELDQMDTRDVWEAGDENHRSQAETWSGLCQDVRADCFSHVTAFGIGHCCPKELAGGGMYLYSPVEETVLIEPPVDFLPELREKLSA
ncbi:hypothetical protein O181_015548 [Austropuccinia psidii MF-1]|uniref:Uncharacterized protein n=1 Tax=Austropuccinia psidii MF-1 TaxID=1389203 RepID=A0A9Q3C2N7_9BASI|nr:hypothetical protein [Austropuccinia psidii MF-1]